MEHLKITDLKQEKTSEKSKVSNDNIIHNLLKISNYAVDDFWIKSKLQKYPSP